MVRIMTDEEWIELRRRHGQPAEVRLSDEAVRTLARIFLRKERGGSETGDTPPNAATRRPSQRGEPSE